MSRGLDRERLALELKRASRPFLVVCVLLAGLLLSLSIIFANIGISLPWNQPYRTNIAVDDAGGVNPRTQDVRFAGVVVGRTGDVKLKNGQAIIGIKMDKDDGPLYKDAKVRVRYETPLEDDYVDVLSRGTPAAGRLGRDDVLQVQNTHTAVDVGRVLDVFQANTRANVKKAIDGYGVGLKDNGVQFKETLNQLAPFLSAAQRLSHETAIRQQETSRLIHNFRLITDELASRDVAVKQLVSAGAGSLGELGSHEADIQQVLVELPPTMTQLQSSFSTLRATEDDLDPAFDDLQPVARTLPSALASLQQVGTTGFRAFSALRKPLPALRTLVGALRPTARNLSAAFNTLRPVPDRLNYVTGLVPDCRSAIQKFFQHTISLGKFQDRRSVILRGEAVVGASSGGGQINDPNQTTTPSCVTGQPTFLNPVR